ncbi:hypothetical protein RSOLAG1IB_09901 [Rhizoctonia solani AG-1 IB]|uniref:Uncharacterized protein n=1 Tax=Thanatephorus cucumeris (strain AG1-IB / isolate 7/3/14) TaxID=1108050 RepID=A0A0B7FWK5_THACB|nr:hypothetical protein RSOLAG1IB_09901 [Rhizoctonia solani AG-1 IB]
MKTSLRYMAGGAQRNNAERKNEIKTASCGQAQLEAVPNPQGSTQPSTPDDSAAPCHLRQPRCSIVGS